MNLTTKQSLFLLCPPGSSELSLQAKSNKCMEKWDLQIRIIFSLGHINSSVYIFCCPQFCFLFLSLCLYYVVFF